MGIKYDDRTLQPRLVAAMNEVWKSSGGAIELDLVGKSKNLLKFGSHATLGTSEAMIWNHGADQAFEVLPTSNSITHLVSSSASDTEPIQVEYHTLSGGNLTFGVQTVTLTGQTGVALGTAGARCSRLRNIGSNDLVGAVYAYEGGAVTGGVPNDDAEVHAKIAAGDNQTQKAATSLSSVDYLLVTQWHGHMLGATSSRVDLELEYKPLGGVWLPTGIDMGLSVTGTTGSPTQLDPVIVIPANSDVRAKGVATAANTSVSVYFGGYLASVV